MWQPLDSGVSEVLDALEPQAAEVGQDAVEVGAVDAVERADQDEEFIYQVTKITYENRAKNSHPAAKKFINEENAPRFTGTEFHPGAIRFYREIGIWPADAGETKADESPSADAPATETEPSGDANDSQ